MSNFQLYEFECSPFATLLYKRAFHFGSFTFCFMSLEILVKDLVKEIELKSLI